LRCLITNFYEDWPDEGLVERTDIIRRGELVGVGYQPLEGLLARILVCDGKIELLAEDGSSIDLPRNTGAIANELREWLKRRKRYVQFAAVLHYPGPTEMCVRRPGSKEWDDVPKEKRKAFKVRSDSLGSENGTRGATAFYCGKHLAGHVRKLRGPLWCLFRGSGVFLSRSHDDPFEDIMSDAWSGAFGPANALATRINGVALAPADISALLDIMQDRPGAKRPVPRRKK
jgi:hypothetical protein